MTSPYLDLPRAGVKASLAILPSTMSNHPNQHALGEDYRELASRLRELARDTQRPYARQELVRLSGIYERRAEYLERRVG